MTNGEKLKEPRWIPVSERLPEANKAVLTYIDTGASKTYCLAYWNDEYEAWEEWMGYGMVEKDRYYKVIAWMPLPKAYREKQSNKVGWSSLENVREKVERGTEK